MTGNMGSALVRDQDIQMRELFQPVKDGGPLENWSDTGAFEELRRPEFDHVDGRHWGPALLNASENYYPGVVPLEAFL